MAIDKRFLRYAMLIGGTAEHDPDRLEELSTTLGAEAELFPFLYLRNNSFLHWKKLRNAIGESATSATLGSATRRKKSRTDHRMAETSRAQLYSAMSAVIQQELQSRKAHFALDDALGHALESQACPNIPLRMKIEALYQPPPSGPLSLSSSPQTGGLTAGKAEPEKPGKAASDREWAQ